MIPFWILSCQSYNNAITTKWLCQIIPCGGRGGCSVELLRTATQDHKIKAPWTSDLNHCFLNLKFTLSLIKLRQN